jgi:capsular exopolysaccharide synthesis family protein
LPPVLEGERTPSPHAEPAFLEYWDVLRRRCRTVFIVTAVLVALAAVISFTMPPLYKAESRISVGKDNPAVLGFKDGESVPSMDESEYNMQLDAQVKILTSETLVLQNLRQLHLAAPLAASDSGDIDSTISLQPLSKEEQALLEDYQSRVQVSRIPHTPIIEIRFSSPDPQMAAKFVNGLLQEYIEQNFKTRYESTRRVSNWLSKQLEDLKAKIQDSQEKLARFQKETGILGTDDKQNIITQKLDDINRELTSAEADRIQKQALYEAMATGDAELTPGISENPVIKQLKEEQAQISSAYAQATAQLGPAHPKVLELKGQLDQADAALGAELDKFAERERNAYLIALRRETMLSRALDGQKQAANQLNERAMQYEILKHEVVSNQQLYDGLSQRLKEAGLSAGLRSGNVRVLDYARVPFSPSTPDIPLNLVLGLVMGCIGGGTLALLQERLDNRLRTPWQVEGLTGLPLLGIVPQIATAGDDRETLLLSSGATGGAEHAATDPEHRRELVESYRALRSSLLSSALVPPQVILVTSAFPFEGKTTTSMNCAVVLAQKGTRVLLVDADLRAPRIHEILGMQVRCGLSTLLAETPGISDSQAIIQYSRVPNLFVLPAGPPHAEPSRLLDNIVMKRKLEAWRKVFTHIVIDTPPVLASSDSLVLSPIVDSVLLSILADHTPRSALLRARNLLVGVNARLTGVVINGVDINSRDFCAYRHYEGRGENRINPESGERKQRAKQ